MEDGGWLWTLDLGPRTSNLQGNRHGGVGDAEGVIHRAVNRVNHPAVFGIQIPGIALLAEQRDLRERGAQDLFDEFLAAHIEFELDVVGVGGIDAFGRVPVCQHEFAGGLRRLDGRFLCFNQIHAGVDASRKARGRGF